MIFIDASAIVAILTREPEADVFVDLLDKANAAITSPIAIFEAALGICRKTSATVDEARDDIAALLLTARIETVSITGREADVALDAFARFGKGRGHPAQLNLGDCFAYAVASNRRVSILFKGDDFSKTDLPSAAGVQ